MDFHSMKRKELQALCKEHNIPANSTNLVMADKLSELLKEKQKPTSRQQTCLKSGVETTDDGEPAVSRRQAKKVRFSPNNDYVEYKLRSGKKEDALDTDMKPKRKFVAKKAAKSAVDNTNNVDFNNDGVQIPVRVTRSRAQEKYDAVIINKNKQGRKAAKNVKRSTVEVKEHEENLGEVTISKVDTLKKDNKKAVKDADMVDESVEGAVGGRVRATRSKAQTSMVNDMNPDLNPQVKKKSGKRVIKDVENIEPAKEIINVPVRSTRSRGQASKVDVANTVANTQTEIKTTRRLTRISDRSNNLSNDASENNQQLPKRKSSRTKGVDTSIENGCEKLGHGKRKTRSEESITKVSESQQPVGKRLRRSRKDDYEVEDSTVLNQNISKVEVGIEKKVTRSKAHLAVKSSEENNGSETDNKAEEPLEHAGKKNVNRRKSVIQKPTRSEIEKPLLGNKGTVKETSKTVGKRQLKEQSADISMLDEGLEDEENATRLEKDFSKDEMKSVASVTTSHKSKKQKGNSSIEKHIIETVYASPVDKSAKRTTRSVAKFVEHQIPSPPQKSSSKKPVSPPPKKSASKKPVSSPSQKSTSKSSALSPPQKSASKDPVSSPPPKSALKTPVSSPSQKSALKEQQESLEFVEEHQGVTPEIKSGGIIKEDGSKRGAKLSGSKPRDSQKHAEEPSSEEAVVSKSDNLELDEKVTETEPTPAIEESSTRFTRSAKKSEKNVAASKTPEKFTRSAIKSERYVAASKTPGRITRSGMKHRGNSGNKLFEKSTTISSRAGKNSNFSKKKNTPLTVQKAVHFKTIGVSSEISKDIEDQILEHSVDVPASESAKLPTEVMEENKDSMVEAAIATENVSMESAENASGISKVPEDQILEHLVDASVPESAKLPTETMEENKDSMSEAVIVTESVSLKDASGVSKDHADQILEHSVDISVTKSANLLSKVMENKDSMSEAAIVTGDVSLESEKDASGVKSPTMSNDTTKDLGEDTEVAGVGIEKSSSSVKITSSDITETPYLIDSLFGDKQLSPVNLPNFEDETRIEKNIFDIKTPLSLGETAERVLDAENQNQEVHENSATFSETQVQEPMEQNADVDNNYEAGPSDACHVSSEQSNEESRLEEVEAITEAVDKFVTSDEAKSQIEQDTLTCNDSLQNPSLERHEVSDNVALDDDGKDSIQNQSTDEPVSENQNLDMGSTVVEVEVEEQKRDSVSQAPLEETDVKTDEDDFLEQSAGDDTHQGLAIDEKEIKDAMATEPSTDANTTEGDDIEAIPVDMAAELSTGENTSEDDGIEAVSSAGKNDDMAAELSTGANTTQGDDDIEAVPYASIDVDRAADLSTGADATEGDDIEAVPSHMAADLSTYVDATEGVDIEAVPSSGNDDDMAADLSSGADATERDHMEAVPSLGKDDDMAADLSTGADATEGDDMEAVPSPGKDDDKAAELSTGADTTEGDDIEALPSAVDDRYAKDGQDVGGDDDPGLIQNQDIHEGFEIENVAADVLIGQSDLSAIKETPEILVTTGNEIRADELSAMDEQDVEGNDEPDLDQNETSLEEEEEEIKPVDALEDSTMNINKDVVSNMGNADGIETDTKNETGSVSPDVSNEHRIEEAETTIENENFKEDCSNQGVDESAFIMENTENFMEDCSNDESDTLFMENISKSPENLSREESLPIVDELDSDEDIGVHGSPVLEESLPITNKTEEFDDAVSDSPTAFAEETEKANTCVDLGSHSSGENEFLKHFSSNEGDDVVTETIKGDKVQDFRSAAQPNLTMDGSCTPSVANPVSKLENASENENVNADVTEDFFNWTGADSSLKALFAPSAQTDNVNNIHEDAVGFTFSDDDNSGEDIGITGSEAHDFHHQWQGGSLRDFNDEAQAGAAQSPGQGERPSNEMDRVLSFEEFTRKFLEDEVDAANEKKKQFEVKDDLSVGTSQSGVKSNLHPGGESEKEKGKQTQPGHDSD